MPTQHFAKLVKARLAVLEWTPYRLAKDTGISFPTVYSFLDGKPVKSDTLAIIFEAVGLIVVEKGSK